MVHIKVADIGLCILQPGKHKKETFPNTNMFSCKKYAKPSSAFPNLLWGCPSDVVSPEALSPEVNTRVVHQEGTVQPWPIRTVEYIDKPGNGTVVSEVTNMNVKSLLKYICGRAY